MQRLAAPPESAPDQGAPAPPRAEAAPSLAGGSLAMLASMGVSSVVVLAFQAVTGRILSTAEFGVLGVGIALVMVLGLFVTSAFPWVVARALSGAGPGSIKAGLLGNLVLGALVSGGLYVLYATRVLDLGEGYGAIVMLVVATTLTNAVSFAFVAVLQGPPPVQGHRRGSGCQRPDAGVRRRAAGGAGVWSLRGRLPGLPCRRWLASPSRTGSLRRYDVWSGPWIVRDVYVQAMPLLVGIMGTQLLMNVNIIGVKLFAVGDDTDTLAGYFQGALVLSRIPVFVIVAVLAALFPFVARHADDPERIRGFTSTLVRYSLVFMLPLTLIMVAVPEHVLSLVFPGEYEAASRPLALLALGMFLLVLTAIFATVFQAMGQARLPGAVIGGAVVLQLALSYWLVPIKGNEGAAVATIASCGVALLLLGVRFIRSFGAPVGMGTLAKVAVASFFLVAFLLALPEAHTVILLAAWALGCIMYVAVLAALRALTPDDVRAMLQPVLKPESWPLARTTALVARLNRLAGSG